MDWIQFLGFIFTIGGLFLWSRTESSNDRKELRNALDTMNSQISSQINSIQQAAAAETKDFHGRLCTLEERYLQLMERFLEKHG